MSARKLHVVYVLPSRYDDEGYVLRFYRGIIPSNTLGVLKSLTESVVQAGELGPDVGVSVEVIDDTVQKVPVKRIARRHKGDDTRVIVGLVGVQSNQFPRASDLALQFRAAGVPVMIGGFHVSGILAMSDSLTPELQTLLDAGVSLVKGEVEGAGVLSAILSDALEDRLQPIYNIKERPELAAAPVPLADSNYLSRYVSKKMGTMDTSRGCPFNCSFCTVVNVQGHKMRHRSAACILRAVEENYAQGVGSYFFTDDNFSRSPVWEEVFDGLIALRERGICITFQMQVDTQAHRMYEFVEKAAQAGCYMVFIGMESVNPENMAAVGKTHNRADEFVEMAETWHDAHVLVHVGYIIGLPFDTHASVTDDITVLRDQIKVDLASFFMLTPLPGSEDHRRMVEEKTPLDADLNDFDTLHETFRHPGFEPGEWARAFRETWDTFYTKQGIINALLRTPEEHYRQMFWLFIWYRFAVLDGTHPMFTGFLRRKPRKERRAIFARESLWRYVWRRTKEWTWMAKTYVMLFFEFQEVWLLTRKRDDPRWATLSEIRVRWTDIQRRLHVGDLRGHYDAAAQELRDLLSTSVDRMQHLARLRRVVSRRVRRRLRRKTREAEAYLRTLDVQGATRQQIVRMERYISDSIVAGYEELAIRYVAQRRKFNAYRRDMLQRLKTGRILTLKIGQIPKVLLFELVVGIRFAMHFITRA